MSKHDENRERDQAGIGPHLRAGERLVPLRDREDLEIPEGEPDIRGWDVRTVSGREIGKVEDLLVDAESDEIVLLRIDMPGTGRHALAPVRLAQVDRARRVVLLDSAELRDASDFPALMRDGTLTDDEVRRFGPDLERTRESTSAANESNAVSAAALESGLPGAERVEERVVERRPVVYEEVVVRRRVVDPERADEAQRAAEKATRETVEGKSESERQDIPEQRP